MSKVIQLRGGQHPQSASPQNAAGTCPLDLAVAPAVVIWRATVVEEIRRSVLLLDLAAQSVRLIALQVGEDQARQTLIGQLDTLERQLAVAREMGRRL